MKIKGHLLFLGTGASMGVPVIGCSCPVCRSTSPYNKRLRPSVLCSAGDKSLLIDCGPDFRQQALHYHIKNLNGVIFTHGHNDHTAGIDDLKIFSFRQGHPLPWLLSKDTAQDIQKRFFYLFEEGPYEDLHKHFNMQILEGERGDVVFQDFKIHYFTYEQMQAKVTGLRFGNLAYVSDIRFFPETVFDDLEGVDTLILSALRFSPSKMHLSIDEAIDFSLRVKAKETWFMHISHDVDHERANAYLPENIRMAYDGLQLEFQAEMQKEERCNLS